MEFSLRPLGFLEILQNDNQQSLAKSNESEIEKCNQKLLGLCRNLYV